MPLTKKQLHQLRKDIILNSLIIKDYDNSLGIDAKKVYYFFDGFVDNIFTIAKENNEKTDFDAVLKKYDNIDTLYNYYMGLDFDPFL